MPSCCRRGVGKAGSTASAHCVYTRHQLEPRYALRMQREQAGTPLSNGSLLPPVSRHIYVSPLVSPLYWSSIRLSSAGTCEYHKGLDIRKENASCSEFVTDYDQLWVSAGWPPFYHPNLAPHPFDLAQGELSTVFEGRASQPVCLHLMNLTDNSLLIPHQLRRLSGVCTSRLEVY